MGKITLDSYVVDMCHRSLFVTGTSRSGTTIMGKLIHSLKGVEYAYEPPVILSLFNLIDRLDPDDWQLLFNNYLFEEFFINALAGRRLNFNRNDDSYIGHAKPDAEINRRIQETHPKNRLIRDESDRHRIAFKMPDAVSYLSSFRKLYPRVRILIMLRNPVDTINSLISKGWYSDESLRGDIFTANGSRHREMYIPHWLDLPMYDEWVDMTETDRCCLHYLYNQTEIRDDYTLRINYDYFVSNADEVIQTVCDNYELEKGEKTDELLSGVKRSDKPRNRNILDRATPELASRVRETGDQISEITVG